MYSDFFMHILEQKLGYQNASCIKWRVRVNVHVCTSVLLFSKGWWFKPRS